jgi:AI-2 transport protein TqsA
VSFLSLVVWTSIFGALGAVLAVLLTILVKAVFFDVSEDRQWVGGLKSGQRVH